MSLPESKYSADLFCRSVAFPCPSGTSEESQKAKVKMQKSKAGTDGGKAFRRRGTACRPLVPHPPCGTPGRASPTPTFRDCIHPFERRLRFCDPEVVTVNSSWELTGGSSGKPRRGRVSSASRAKRLGLSGAARGGARRSQRLVRQPHEVLRLQQAGNRNVFVDGLPVDTNATADEFPVGSLLCRRPHKPREPGKGNRHRPTVGQDHAQIVFGTRHIYGERLSSLDQSTHATSPGRTFDFPRRAGGFRSIRGRGNRGCPRVQPTPARTSYNGQREQRGCAVALVPRDCKKRSGNHESAKAPARNKFTTFLRDRRFPFARWETTSAEITGRTVTEVV